MAGYNPGSYESERRDVNFRHSTDSANNAYGRFLGQQRGERGLGDMTRNYKQSYRPLGASFNQRGLAAPGMSSGIQQQAMRNYVGDYSREYGRGTQDLAQNLQQYDMNQLNMNSWKENEMANIAARQAADIAAAANNIGALQQYLGGT